jgi:glycosyltransferase involved in cell wall biosynthesis
MNSAVHPVTERAGNRILMVSPSGLGGIQLCCARLSEGFRDLGWQVHILFEAGDVRSRENPALPSGVTCSTVVHSLHDNFYRSVRQMVRFIEKGGFSVIHPNTSAIAYRAIGLLGPRRPVAIGGCHGDNPHDYACNTEFARYLDHVFAVSSRCANELTKRLAGCGLGVSLIHNATRLPPRPPQQEPSGRLEIAYAGRFERVKRLGDMIEVACKLRTAGVDFRFSMAGEGAMRNELVELVRKNRLQEAVAMIGRRSLDEIGAMMARAHLNLLLSESEGFGSSALDGMSRGSVPIVTDACGCVDAIQHGRNGFVVGVGDVEGVLHHILHLNNDRHLLSSMAHAAYETVREHFTIEEEMKRQLRVLALAREHHQKFAAETPPWKYEPPGLLDRPAVPNWLARALRQLKYGRTAAS